MEKCWAASLGDCSERISREHYVSGCLFPSGKVIVSGFPWCEGRSKEIGLQSLTQNALCKSHNNQLSALDSEMLKFFDSLREGARLIHERSSHVQNDWDVEHFSLSSILMERWLLKTLINFTFQRPVKFGDYEGEYGSPPEELVRIAFGKSTFEGNSGMYISFKPGESITMLESVILETFTERDSIICAQFTVCGFRFVLSLVQDEVHVFRGAELSHKKINLDFRAPTQRLKMAHSHTIHIN